MNLEVGEVYYLDHKDEFYLISSKDSDLIYVYRGISELSKWVPLFAQENEFKKYTVGEKEIYFGFDFKWSIETVETEDPEMEKHYELIGKFTEEQLSEFLSEVEKWEKVQPRNVVEG